MTKFNFQSQNLIFPEFFTEFLLIFLIPSALYEVKPGIKKINKNNFSFQRNLKVVFLWRNQEKLNFVKNNYPWPKIFTGLEKYIVLSRKMYKIRSKLIFWTKKIGRIFFGHTLNATWHGGHVCEKCIDVYFIGVRMTRMMTWVTMI